MHPIWKATSKRRKCFSIVVLMNNYNFDTRWPDCRILFVALCCEAMKLRKNQEKRNHIFSFCLSFLFQQTRKCAAQLESGKQKLWIGLVLDPEHGWRWSDLKPFRYLRWSPGRSACFKEFCCSWRTTVVRPFWPACCWQDLNAITDKQFNLLINALSLHVYFLHGL